jgi:hypothetical protein
MRVAPIASSLLIVLAACRGDRGASAGAQAPTLPGGEGEAAGSERPASDPPAPAPAAADEACQAAGRIDVGGPVARPGLARADGGAVAPERPLLLLPDRVGEQWGPRALALVAAAAPTLTYRELDDASRRALDELGEGTLLQVIRDAQAARGHRVIGRYAFIGNYGLVLDGGGAILAILEDSTIAEPADVAACTAAILAAR